MGRSLRAPGSATSSLREEYVPGTDHKDLVLEAIEIWSHGPGCLQDPEKALAYQKEMRRVREESLEHMEKVRDAFFYELEHASVGQGPFYRGHGGIADFPAEGAFSWSRDPEVAFLFASVAPWIDGPNGRRAAPPLETILEEGLDLGEGEGLFITGFTSNEAEAGVDINHSGQDSVRRAALDRLQKGEPLDISVTGDNGTKTIHFTSEKFKRVVYLAAVKKLGQERVRKALGVGRLSEEEVIRFVSGRSLSQMNSFLDRLGEESISRIWKDRTEEIMEMIKNAQTITPTSQYATEEEVVVLTSRLRETSRTDVCLARSSEDIKNLTEEQARDLFLGQLLGQTAETESVSVK